MYVCLYVCTVWVEVEVASALGFLNFVVRLADA